MKRVLVLVPLIVLVIWLVNGAPTTRRSQPNDAVLPVETTAAAEPVSDPCNPCDPDGSAEWSCLTTGGVWNSDTCQCYYPSCDPSGILESQCYVNGGVWHPNSCYCDVPSCNPSAPVVTGIVPAGHWTECHSGYLWECDGSFVTYTMFCQNGSIFSQWTEYNPICTNDFTTCGGGGGGGGDCWYDLDCWCPTNSWDPDCEEYCWWNYCWIE
jgi:hypothetical protein